ncbi:hypothetical protein KIN20_021332 [Parelaphostrongylus tenuis]|uniref:Uncharacterized protein n=1 Tax=Parelaphostrongylus tenuis TaxID=148309 RepID=A0AAD5QUF9_PARTN|nr:hypothetical protein KIN20_021332 [Parelaphostrongylus tenuis]
MEHTRPTPTSLGYKCGQKNRNKSCGGENTPTGENDNHRKQMGNLDVSVFRLTTYMW